MDDYEVSRRMRMAGASILIVDDHEMIRFGVRGALDSAWRIPDTAHAPTFFEAGTVAESIEVLDNNEIDVAILDLRLTDGSGLEVARYIRDNGLDTVCVVLTSVKSARAVIACYEIGTVSAILEKSDGLKPLAEAVEQASRGLMALSARDADRARAEMVDQGFLDRSVLTPKESELADLVADGLSDQEIAERLYIAPATVRNVLSKMYRKLEIDGRNRLTAMVWQERPEQDFFPS
jgi:two-component system response regulator DevR